MTKLIARKFKRTVPGSRFLGQYHELVKIGSRLVLQTATISYLWDKDCYQIEQSPRIIEEYLINY